MWKRGERAPRASRLGASVICFLVSPWGCVSKARLLSLKKQRKYSRRGWCVFLASAKNVFKCACLFRKSSSHLASHNLCVDVQETCMCGNSLRYFKDCDKI